MIFWYSYLYTVMVTTFFIGRLASTPETPKMKSWSHLYHSYLTEHLDWIASPCMRCAWMDWGQVCTWGVGGAWSSMVWPQRERFWSLTESSPWSTASCQFQVLCPFQVKQKYFLIRPHSIMIIFFLVYQFQVKWMQMTAKKWLIASPQ